jgi:hypothetical protein
VAVLEVAAAAAIKLAMVLIVCKVKHIGMTLTKGGRSTAALVLEKVTYTNALRWHVV